MRLTLENARSNGGTLLSRAVEIDLGHVRFIEVQHGLIYAFVDTNDDPDGPDPDVKYWIKTEEEEVTVWMSVADDNWAYRGQRLNILADEV